jgi:hypothetical protein
VVAGILLGVPLLLGLLYLVVPHSGVRKTPSGPPELVSRFQAALQITSLYDRDNALAHVARDAAQAGAGDVAKESVRGMSYGYQRDQTAAACAPVLANTGHASDATEVANLIASDYLRNQVLANLARGGSTPPTHAASTGR